MQITQFKPTSLANLELKRVAVYARVSSDKDSAENSLGEQIAYFSEVIKRNPSWIFVGIYADDGISGTLDSRPEMQRLLTDCRAGNVDIIVTKSVTRFARNTLFLLETLRELKGLGIDVRFENDRVNLMSAPGELLLTLLAMHAEDQARAASENKHWQITRDFEKGKPTFFRIYGFSWINNQLVIIPEEAEIVRRIYSMYLDGMGRESIAKTLNREGVSKRGTSWAPSSILEILTNEKYVGELLLQKWYTPDFRTKKQFKNKGQWRQYHVTDSHDPIIDRETFEAAQREIERRRAAHPESRGELAQSLFVGLIKCVECGANYKFKKQRERSSNSSYPIWICITHLTLGKDKCSSKRIRESILVEKTKEALGLSADTELTREIILKHITSIESAADNRLRFFFKDGSVKVTEWQNPSRSNSWTPEMRQKARERKLAQDKARKGETDG